MWFHCNNLKERKHKHKANQIVMQTRTVTHVCMGSTNNVVNNLGGTSKTGKTSQEKREGKHDTFHRDFE